MAAYSAIKNSQNEAWMRAIERGHKDDFTSTTNKDHLRMCDDHFHSSLFIAEKDGVCLKCGASPTMRLSKFNVTNPGHEETAGLPRIVGLEDDLVIVNERAAKIRVSKVTPSPLIHHDSIILREERAKKRASNAQLRMLDLESSMKINDMETFMNNFLRVSIDWFVKIINSNEAKLTRIVQDVHHEHEAVESLTVRLNKLLASVTVTQSRPDSIHVDVNKHISKTAHSTHECECADKEYELEKVILQITEKKDYTIVLDQGVCYTVRF